MTLVMLAAHPRIRLRSTLGDDSPLQQGTDCSDPPCWYDATYYHCTDAQFSTIAVLDGAGVLQERVSYDPYGKARHHKPADCADGDGAANSNDLLLVITTWGSAPAGGDVTRDGAVDVNDQNLVIAQWSSAIAAGQLSTTDNQIGWDGYVFNAELDADGLYTVRFRHYRPGFGRWCERDPIQTSPLGTLSRHSRPMSAISAYMDGMNLYETSRCQPVRYLDPSGLITQADDAALTNVINMMIAQQAAEAAKGAGVTNWCLVYLLQFKIDLVTALQKLVSCCEEKRNM